MGVLNEQEKNRIIEEEAVRAQVRRKYEQKSSGAAGVLSTICPGLGQIYNGQFGKGSAFFLVVLVGLVLFCYGIVLFVKKDTATTMKIATDMGVVKSAPVEMNEDGIVLGETEKQDEPAPAQTSGETPKTNPLKQLPKKATAITLIGLIMMAEGAHQAVRDAIKTSQRLNSQLKT
jgi:TM2 domain-containing membrane protein YozV